ncbi:hypothetical protein CRENBAI_025261 [Crenichthys baileyi]|uniref:Voltage-gated delayed rectifier potassium channel KCNH4 n=1 Tax=Crenichthys baileyi TaxID=28760 RepID=A0AAV9QW90_9TELE
MPVMKGLLAPQNTFLDTIATRFDGTHSNFLLGNAQGHRGYPIVYCSDGFCELTGFTRTEVMQKNCTCDFLHGADTCEHVAQQIEKALEGREEYRAEVHFYKKNGVAFWCLLDIVPIKNEKGEMVLFLFSFKDITDTYGKGHHSSKRDEDNRCRRKSSSHFREARKHGRTMLYQLTSHFSRGGKGDVNLSGEKNSLTCSNIVLEVVLIKDHIFVLSKYLSMQEMELNRKALDPGPIGKAPGFRASKTYRVDLFSSFFLPAPLVLKPFGKLGVSPAATLWTGPPWDLFGRKKKKQKNREIGWLHELGKRLETPYINSTVGGPTVRSSYIAALYFTLSSLTSVGFGNVCANTDAEKIFSICTMLIGASLLAVSRWFVSSTSLLIVVTLSDLDTSLMHAVVFGNVTAIIQRMYSRRSLYHTRMNDLKDFIRVHGLPQQLKQRMLEYFQTTWSVNNGIDANELLHDFPDELRADIAMHLNKDILQLPVFKGASRGCLRSLSLHIKTSFCVPGEYLIRQGDALHANYFVCSGSLEVLKDSMVLAILGKGDLIGSDLPGTEQVIKTNADVKALTYCDLQYISVRGLREVLELYPEYANVFTTDIHNNLTYNLREGSQDEQSPKLPPIVETKTDDPDDTFHLSPATRSRRNLLLPNFTSPVRRTSLGNLLGDELRQFNALRRCRSPNLSRGFLGQSLSPQPPSKKEHSTPLSTPTQASTSAKGESGAEQKPAKLLIPTVTCFPPPDLSPRVVDGIEDNSHTFHFTVEHSKPNSRTGGITQEKTQTNASLLQETEEVKESIAQLNLKVGTLNQEATAVEVLT